MSVFLYAGPEFVEPTEPSRRLAAFKPMLLDNINRTAGALTRLARSPRTGKGPLKQLWR